MRKPVRSTIFRRKRPFSKEEQEGRVAAVFAESYRLAKGITLDDGKPVPEKRQPPDWVFSSHENTRVGVEMFELEQFNEARGLIAYLTDRIYSEFERRGLSERFIGMVLSTGLLLDVDTAERLKGDWSSKGIGKPIARTARELVDLVSKSVPSRDAVPLGDFGLVLPIDHGSHPALSVLCRRMRVARTRDSDPRRSDGKAAPLVMLASGYAPSPQLVQQRIERSLTEKMRDRPRWTVSVDRAIVVAHDLPREQWYEIGFAMDWREHLTRAATQQRVIDIFDGVWLVTYQTGECRAHEICSRS